MGCTRVLLYSGLIAFMAILAGVIVMLEKKVPAEITVDRWKTGVLNGIFEAYDSFFDKVGAYVGMEYYWILRQAPFPSRMKTEHYTAQDEKIGGVSVRFYKSITESSLKDCVLLYFHGGGFAAGSVDAFNEVMSDIVETTGINVISVDYQLTPEHKPPAGLQDCLKVTQTVLDNPQLYGFKSYQVFIAGDSAGGNMAAVISQKLKNMYADPIGGAILIYPLVQTVTTNLPSYKTKSYALLTTALLGRFFTSYFDLDLSKYQVFGNSTHTCLDDDVKNAIEKYIDVKELHALYNRDVTLDLTSHGACDREVHNRIKKTVLDPEIVSPLFMEDLSRSPNTLVILAGVDILLDEGYLYYQRLRKSSPYYNKELLYLPDAIHGFYSILGKYGQPTQYYKAQAAIHEFLSMCYLR